MKRLEFKREHSVIFSAMYSAFATSKRTPKTRNELVTSCNILRALKGISSEVQLDDKGMSIDSRYTPGDRILLSDGGTIELDDIDFLYLLQSVMPPAIDWRNSASEIGNQVVEFLEGYLKNREDGK